MRSALLAQRTEVPGATLGLVILAAGRRQLVGVDLESGAFVRARCQTPLTSKHRLRAYDIVETTVWPIPLEEHLDQPEAVLADGIHRIGRLPGWRRERVLRPLMHPRRSQLLGFGGHSAPLWTFDGCRPSVGVVTPDHGPVVRVNERGVTCEFTFRDVRHVLPLEDPTLLARLDWLPGGRVQGPMLASLLGYRPRHLLVVLAKPRNGYCSKVVASLLPR